MSNFGSRSYMSTYKKLLVLKRFFRWYYFIPNVRFFNKVFSWFFLRKKVTFRYLATFFFMLESNVLVLLVRAQFVTNLLQAFNLVKGELVAVNGFFVNRNFFSTHIGDLVEYLNHWHKILGLVFWKRFLLFRSFRKRYFSGVRTKLFLPFTMVRRRRRRRNLLLTRKRKRILPRLKNTVSNLAYRLHLQTHGSQQKLGSYMNLLLLP